MIQVYFMGMPEAKQPNIITFPGGEPHVKCDSLYYGCPALIYARPRNGEEFMSLLVFTDALRRAGAGQIELFMPYFPGARQDRSSLGTALTAKVYADIINAQKYARVIVLDPHSDVVPALLDRCIVIPAEKVSEEFMSLPHPDGIICPDAGAEKRTYALAQALKVPVIHARKHRNMETGALDGFRVEPFKSAGYYVVADDICDGGATFVGLAEEIARTNPADYKLGLWVTHGIFSKGTEALQKHYRWIGSTDSFPSKIEGGLPHGGAVRTMHLDRVAIPHVMRLIGW